MILWNDIMSDSITEFADLMNEKYGRCDLHTHTFLSDGELLPAEHIRRAGAMGMKAIAITDHASFSNMEYIIPQIVRDCEIAEDIIAIPGVELTHIPPSKINEAAVKARKLGAEWIIVHGETIVEPVKEGTNAAALRSTEVDMLAHPGLMSEEEAEIAFDNGKYIEISARKGHSLTNGHVAALAKKHHLSIMINSDAHTSEDFIDTKMAVKVAMGAGMLRDDVEKAFSNHLSMIKKFRRNH